MTRALTAFAHLGPRFWDYHTCVRTAHFCARRDERGFDELRLPEIWEHGEWLTTEQGFIIKKTLPGTGKWELVVAIDEGVDDAFGIPWLITVWSHEFQAA